MEKSSRWFDEGASTLRLVLDGRGLGYRLPPTDSWYACPCCLVLYPRSARNRVLTLEDVPPKALGGRRMLLTCVGCNNSSGTNFDAHAAQKAAADAFVDGKASDRKVRATSYLDGIQLHGTAQSTEDGISLVGIPERNDPAKLAAYLRALASLGEDENWDRRRFSFTIHTRYDEIKARLSWIRAAYLTAFAALGWEYILRSVMDPIRHQLKSPEIQVLETYVFRDPGSSDAARRVLLVSDPYELRCVAVMFGEYGVFLPALTNPTTWDEVAAAFCHRRAAGDRLNVNLRGKEVPWPKWPTYFFDRPVGS